MALHDLPCPFPFPGSAESRSHTCAARAPALSASERPPAKPTTSPRHLEPKTPRCLVHGLQARSLPLPRPDPRAPRFLASGPAQGHRHRHQAAGQGGPGGSGQRGPQSVQHHDPAPPSAAGGNVRRISTRSPSAPLQNPAWISRDRAPAAREGGERAVSERRRESGGAQRPRSSLASRLRLLSASFVFALGRPRKQQRSGDPALPPPSAPRSRDSRKTLPAGAAAPSVSRGPRGPGGPGAATDCPRGPD